MMQENFIEAEDLEELKHASFSKVTDKRLLNSIDFSMLNGAEKAKAIADNIREAIEEGKRIAFVSGNFNIVHPGHLRLLNFAAECADILVVGVHEDSSPAALLPAHLRLEGIKAIGCVNFAFLMPVSPEEFVVYLKPDIVIKGKEHEQHYNPEQAVVDGYGGKLLFSSGEMRFSSMDLLRRELQELNLTTIKKPTEFFQRHGISNHRLSNLLHRFSDLSVVVVGDLIVDEYLTCDPLGLSREDPTIVVTPIKRDVFLGGAGIVAAHARSLGAKVTYFSIIGDDEAASFATKAMNEYQVNACLLKDKSRPTTLKQRFRADGKTLLRVSHLRHHDIDNELADKLLAKVTSAIKKADLVIFSDFNYGCLSQPLVDNIVKLCRKSDIPMVADSQSSSQIGDISRFQGMLLVTPTEHEARLAVRDQSSGLFVLAESVRKKAQAEHLFITLGAEGLLILTPDEKNDIECDQLPAFNVAPKDVAGGGDAMLTCASLALAVGANIWESAYLASIASACHVGRIGNLPLSRSEVLQELMA